MDPCRPFFVFDIAACMIYETSNTSVGSKWTRGLGNYRRGWLIQFPFLLKFKYLQVLDFCSNLSICRFSNFAQISICRFSNFAQISICRYVNSNVAP